MHASFTGLKIYRLEQEMIRLKEMPVGFFKDPEAMAIHQEYLHNTYWELEEAKKGIA